ncbi:MAG: hypothetical protein NkDv07_0132 [Candidatus Improbicoccus devescovinae]|nr:MAG: hypothetical protein NkDv07_0132 [Candidatus Improbicoccus devescovinae]
MIKYRNNGMFVWEDNLMQIKIKKSLSILSAVLLGCNIKTFGVHPKNINSRKHNASSQKVRTVKKPADEVPMNSNLKSSNLPDQTLRYISSVPAKIGLKKQTMRNILLAGGAIILGAVAILFGFYIWDKYTHTILIDVNGQLIPKTLFFGNTKIVSELLNLFPDKDTRPEIYINVKNNDSNSEFTTSQSYPIGIAIKKDSKLTEVKDKTFEDIINFFKKNVRGNKNPTIIISAQSPIVELNLNGDEIKKLVIQPKKKKPEETLVFDFPGSKEIQDNLDTSAYAKLGEGLTYDSKKNHAQIKISSSGKTLYVFFVTVGVKNPKKIAVLSHNYNPETTTIQKFFKYVHQTLGQNKLKIVCRAENNDLIERLKHSKVELAQNQDNNSNCSDGIILQTSDYQHTDIQTAYENKGKLSEPGSRIFFDGKNCTVWGVSLPFDSEECKFRIILPDNLKSPNEINKEINYQITAYIKKRVPKGVIVNQTDATKLEQFLKHKSTYSIYIWRPDTSSKKETKETYERTGLWISDNPSDEYPYYDYKTTEIKMPQNVKAHGAAVQHKEPIILIDNETIDSFQQRINEANPSPDKLLVTINDKLIIQEEPRLDNFTAALETYLSSQISEKAKIEQLAALAGDPKNRGTLALFYRTGDAVTSGPGEIVPIRCSNNYGLWLRSSPNEPFKLENSIIPGVTIGLVENNKTTVKYLIKQHGSAYTLHTNDDDVWLHYCFHGSKSSDKKCYEEFTNCITGKEEKLKIYDIKVSPDSLPQYLVQGRPIAVAYSWPVIVPAATSNTAVVEFITARLKQNSQADIPAYDELSKWLARINPDKYYNAVQVKHDCIEISRGLDRDNIRDGELFAIRIAHARDSKTSRFETNCPLTELESKLRRLATSVLTGAINPTLDKTKDYSYFEFEGSHFKFFGAPFEILDNYAIKSITPAAVAGAAETKYHKFLTLFDIICEQTPAIDDQKTLYKLLWTKPFTNNEALKRVLPDLKKIAAETKGPPPVSEFPITVGGKQAYVTFVIIKSPLITVTHKDEPPQAPPQESPKPAEQESQSFFDVLANEVVNAFGTIADEVAKKAKVIGRAIQEEGQKMMIADTVIQEALQAEYDNNRNKKCFGTEMKEGEFPTVIITSASILSHNIGADMMPLENNEIADSIINGSSANIIDVTNKTKTKILEKKSNNLLVLELSEKPLLSKLNPFA